MKIFNRIKVVSFVKCLYCTIYYFRGSDLQGSECNLISFGMLNMTKFLSYQVIKLNYSGDQIFAFFAVIELINGFLYLLCIYSCYGAFRSKCIFCTTNILCLIFLKQYNLSHIYRYFNYFMETIIAAITLMKELLFSLGFYWVGNNNKNNIHCWKYDIFPLLFKSDQKVIVDHNRQSAVYHSR